MSNTSYFLNSLNELYIFYLWLHWQGNYWLSVLRKFLPSMYTRRSACLFKLISLSVCKYVAKLKARLIGASNSAVLLSSTEPFSILQVIVLIFGFVNVSTSFLDTAFSCSFKQLWLTHCKLPAHHQTTDRLRFWLAGEQSEWWRQKTERKGTDVFTNAMRWSKVAKNYIKTAVTATNCSSTLSKNFLLALS